MNFIHLDNDSIFNVLKEQELNPLIEKDSGLVYILIETDDKGTPDTQSPLFFVIRNDNTLLQLISYLPFSLKPHLKEEIARLLHLLNKDLDLPGFGMDEEQGLIFYRSVIPCLESQIAATLLKVYISTIQLVCESFTHAIGLVSSGSLTVQSLQNEKMKHMNDENKSPPLTT
ncbi:YbjN domain-containing protein [Candidatus Clavichlamydia salmonicola]|uniref:YbjN domain-containing protein n=1 Tax=Candidatus Clavichlamydia salmonicola TaxID=469812 RepID=UPI001891E57A|nr:YbjN domain-containing protein [Candidatus Clavichlamydia salmonicola]